MIGIIQFSESSLLINFEQKIEEKINAEVVSLKSAIEKKAIYGVHFCIPAYCSLLVKYDPFKISFDILKNTLSCIYDSIKKTVINNDAKKLIIPVCYETPHALDLNELAKELNTPIDEIIKMHTFQSFKVYMLGFLPGFPYMGILPKELSCKRKANPRLKVPIRSVALAGQQTGIYPIESPGGWQVIGQTPLDIFNLKNGPDFLFSAGDEVQFVSVNQKEFISIRNDVENGRFDYHSIYA